MRILFLSHGYPPYALGGLTLRCQEVAEALRQRGHTIHVLTSRYGLDGVAVHEEGVTRALHFQARMDYYRPLEFFLTRPRKERENLAILRETIDSFAPDIVFVWGLWNLSRALPYWAERWMGPERVAYAIADYWLIEPDIHHAYWRLPARRPLVEAAKAAIRPMVLRKLEEERRSQALQLGHVTCCSEYTANKLAAAGALPHGARVIYNGIDPQPFMVRPRPKRSGAPLRLLYFGGLSDHKGVHTAVEALALLKDRGSAVGLDLALVGDGHPDYVAHLRMLAAQHGVLGQIVFHGSVSRDEIPALLARHDLFLFTSIWEEPFGRTIVEAMAAGLAVIGSEVGGSIEIMRDGANALTYPAGDASALADRIVQLRESPELHERIVKAGRKTVLERFTLDRMVDEIEEWLSEIVSGARS
jgi:glycosyltransferase involved in cell wall biosynthesis